MCCGFNYQDIYTSLLTVLRNYLTLSPPLMACSLSYVIINYIFFWELAGSLPFLAPAAKQRSRAQERVPRAWAPPGQVCPVEEADWAQCPELQPMFPHSRLGPLSLCTSFPLPVGRVITYPGFRTTTGLQASVCIKVIREASLNGESLTEFDYKTQDVV